MARTQAPDYDQRREAIVSAAAALYARRGFNGASVADLAEACGNSKSLIYHYYSSKEDILFDVMISHVRALDEAARAVADGQGAAAEKLRALARNFMTLYVGAANRHKVLLNELDNLDDVRRGEIVETQRGLIEIVRGLLLEIEPALAQRPGEAFAAAMLFFGMINWTHTWFDAAGPVSADALADMAVNLTLGGLGKAT
ncbi:TetR/AcrR family transcriptional regulator [Terricaulis sp.]|uniref:TetR/AcrR family transcriptional regulator n=1 Tax=Terricaulis sp. TaxID=2768686 RepID=UPI003783E670